MTQVKLIKILKIIIHTQLNYPNIIYLYFSLHIPIAKQINIQALSINDSIRLIYFIYEATLIPLLLSSMFLYHPMNLNNICSTHLNIPLNFYYSYHPI